MYIENMIARLNQLFYDQSSLILTFEIRNRKCYFQQMFSSSLSPELNLFISNWTFFPYGPGSYTLSRSFHPHLSSLPRQRQFSSLSREGPDIVPPWPCFFICCCCFWTIGSHGSRFGIFLCRFGPSLET